MSCFSPKPVVFTVGRPKIIYQFPKEKWNIHWKFQDKLPCRSCIGCKTDYTKEWGLRGTLEARQYENNYFITLTYNNQNLPYNEQGLPTLCKDDITKFVNSLRKHFERLGHFGIKYIIAGEYGSKTKRPHYHLIMFNLPLTDLVTVNHKKSGKIKKVTYSPLIERLWAKNTTFLCPNEIIVAQYETIRYCVAYSFKKLKKSQTDHLSVEPERIRFSKGIGLAYYLQNKDKIWDNDNLTIATGKKLMSTIPPKYYDRLLKKENPELLEQIKEARREKAIRQIELELISTNLTWWELMALKQRKLWASIKKNCKSPLKGGD